MCKERFFEVIELFKKGDVNKLISKIKIKYGSRKTLFTEFYKNNVWGSQESISGPGSELRNTAKIIKQMPALLRKYNIRSINDAPCGDFNYMKEINLSGIKYTGYDIVNELTELNIKKYKKKNLDFIHFDVVNEVLPFCDMILSRDMLIHFSYKDSLKTIENFKKSGAKYLLTNNYPQISVNLDIKTGAWRPINLLIGPYFFDQPIEFIEEYSSLEHGSKQLALFKLEQVKKLQQ